MELKQRIKETEIIRMAALTPKTFQRKVTELEYDLPDLLQSLKLQHPIDSTPHKERPSLRSIYVVQYFPLPPKYCRCAVRDENFCESALAVTPALSPIIDTAAPVFRPNAFRLGEKLSVPLPSSPSLKASASFSPPSSRSPKLFCFITPTLFSFW